MQHKVAAASIEMSGGIATVADRSARRSSRTAQRTDRLGIDSAHTRSSIGKSIADMSVASSFYGGGVTITGGGPDETFKDEFGNECSSYANRTIVINEHMTSADETRNHNGIDIPTPGFGMTNQKRAIAFLFVAATIVLLLFVLLDVGGSNTGGGNRADKLSAIMGNSNTDDWDDDDDAWDKYTKSAVGDD